MSSFSLRFDNTKYLDACDVFARLLPLLAQPGICPSRRRRATWKVEADFAAGVEKIHEVVSRVGRVPAVMAEDLITALSTGRSSGGESKAAFALLLGIDKAFAGLRPFASDGLDALDEYRDRLSQQHRLDSGNAPPAVVLPRRGGHLRAQLQPERLSDEFEHLLFVSDGRQLDYAVVDPQHDMPIQDLRDKEYVKIACVPFLGSYAELQITSEPFVGAVGCYRIQPDNDMAKWGARIDRVLAQLESESVDFVLLPELAVNDELLRLWQQKLQQRSNSGRANPGWVLAGTGGVGTPQRGELPPNRAVLLCCRDGSTVMEQDKMRPFDMTADTIVRWKLDPYLGDHDDLREGMREGEMRRIRDLRAGRVAIFICEDHGRTIQEVSRIAEHEPTLVFVPIFSEPIRRFYWEHKAALEQVTTMGSSVVVANSCAVPVPADTSGKMKQQDYGTSMAAWPAEKTPGYWSAETSISPFPNTPNPEAITYFTVPLS